ncbi:hypothetical protein BDW69DRAFT_172547 [Aspergillus filifer]
MRLHLKPLSQSLPFAAAILDQSFQSSWLPVPRLGNTMSILPSNRVEHFSSNENADQQASSPTPYADELIQDIVEFVGDFLFKYDPPHGRTMERTTSKKRDSSCHKQPKARAKLTFETTEARVSKAKKASLAKYFSRAGIMTACTS